MDKGPGRGRGPLTAAGVQRAQEDRIAQLEADVALLAAEAGLDLGDPLDEPAEEPSEG
jgi:hypothetical protein